MTDGEITIKLSRAKAIAIFEWAQRFMESQNPQFTHPADAIVVDTIASELEWALPEVFTDEYPKLLAASRRAIESEYRASMGAQYSDWLDHLEYQDIQGE